MTGLNSGYTSKEMMYIGNSLTSAKNSEQEWNFRISEAWLNLEDNQLHTNKTIVMFIGGTG